MPLTLPAESMSQASFVSESAFLVDPLDARIEVVDAKAHPVQTAGAQRVVDDELGDLGSVALTEDLGSGEPDSVVGRLVVEVDLVEDCLTQKRAVLGPDDSPVRPVVVLSLVASHASILSRSNVTRAPVSRWTSDSASATR